MTPKRKDGLITPEKRKGHVGMTYRWWYAICGGVVGAMAAAAVFQIYESSAMRAYPSLIAIVVFFFGLLFFLFVGVIAANAYYNPPRELPEVRQNPDNPSVIQQWHGHDWHDSLTVLPASLDAAPVPLEKTKSSSAWPSFLWFALVAAATSLYSLFLSRPPRE